MAFDGKPDSVPTLVQQYLLDLKKEGFEGDILTDTATRLINATDNSVYQIMPQAVCAPKTGKDLNRMMAVATLAKYQEICFTPRGGGTGTNGQALNNSIIIDTSKYLTRLLDINYAEGWVHIEPGVVLDQLNKAIEGKGYYFPVYISPSKSATLGGMIATDACGKGSRVHGKTGDYILSMTCLMSDGQEFTTDKADFQKLTDILKDGRETYLTDCPDLPRGVSGLDLQRALDDNRPNLNRLIAGSEGCLAVIKDIKLRIVKKPKFKSMVVVSYDSFDQALRHVGDLLKFDPAAIETIDDRIIGLARNDYLWQDVASLLPAQTDSIEAIHFIEFEEGNELDLKKKIETFTAALQKNKAVKNTHTTNDPKDIKSIIAIRSRCVGLLGNKDGDKRPIPFIEDTAVPPENLADYIADYRALLKSYDLEYGCFGHVDAGVLHVRPALDMRDDNDQKLYRELSDKVVALVKKHGGILWGEHGKGLRAEYTKELVGTAYYRKMQEVKDFFDLNNRFNPSKIVATGKKSLLKMDEPAFRGDFDKQISDDRLKFFPKATQCNGNGQCFSAMPDDMMCPSYKITKDRRHSPKGRASLLREWLRLKTIDKIKARKFAPEVFDALKGCLSCKACTSTCPVHVNIPDMKVEFLSQYKKQGLRDYMVGLSETFSRIPLLFRPQNFLGLVDIPKRSPCNLKTLIKERGFSFFDEDIIKDTINPVLIIQDAYTSHYESGMVLSILQLMRKLGYEPLIVPFRESGKSWHVRGFIKKFKNIALNNIAYFENLTTYDAPIVGIDPSITLVYRDEYHTLLDRPPGYHILLLQEFLINVIERGDLPKIKTIPKSSYNFFLHCTEKTMHPESIEAWKHILKKFDVNIKVQETGCCGMAGAYGHEIDHLKNSKGLYKLSWKNKVDESSLVTGFSCRCQIKRMEEFSAKHPLELLNDLL